MANMRSSPGILSLQDADRSGRAQLAKDCVNVITIKHGMEALMQHLSADLRTHIKGTLESIPEAEHAQAEVERLAELLRGLLAQLARLDDDAELPDRAGSALSLYQANHPTVDGGDAVTTAQAFKRMRQDNMRASPDTGPELHPSALVAKVDELFDMPPKPFDSGGHGAYARVFGDLSDSDDPLGKL
jgi:hypothetical protein